MNQSTLLEDCEAYLCGLGFVKDDNPKCVAYIYKNDKDCGDSIFFAIHEGCPYTINIELMPNNEAERIKPLINYFDVYSMDDIVWLFKRQGQLKIIASRSQSAQPNAISEQKANSLSLPVLH